MDNANVNANMNNHRLVLYGISVGVDGILVQTVAQMTECTHENKNVLLISLAALLMNAIAAVWVFSDIQHNYWKAIVFKAVFVFTKILSPYVAFSTLEPKWFTWHGFAAISTVVIIVDGHNELQIMFIWSYQRSVVAKNYLLEKVSELMLRFHLATDSAV